MFIRPNFVTNSSGTSFIGWGVALRPDVLEKALENRYPEEFECILDGLDRGDPVMLEHCRESGWNYLIVKDSRENADQYYMRLRETYTTEEWWKEELSKWCKEHGVNYDDPHWIFATVY